MERERLSLGMSADNDVETVATTTAMNPEYCLISMFSLQNDKPPGSFSEWLNNGFAWGRNEADGNQRKNTSGNPTSQYYRPIYPTSPIPIDFP